VVYFEVEGPNDLFCAVGLQVFSPQLPVSFIVTVLIYSRDMIEYK
jgi:hypothetical protein